MFNKYLYITLCFALKNWLSNFMHAMCFWNNLHQVHNKLRYLISCALCVSRITFTRYIYSQKIRKTNNVKINYEQ